MLIALFERIAVQNNVVSACINATTGQEHCSHGLKTWIE